MGGNIESVVLMVMVVPVGLAAFALYRWSQRRRARRVEAWVRAYLQPMCAGGAPEGLHVNCSDDRLWPVLVEFDEAGARRRMWFRCPGADSTFYRLPDVEAATGA